MESVFNLRITQNVGLMLLYPIKEISLSMLIGRHQTHNGFHWVGRVVSSPYSAGTTGIESSQSSFVCHGEMTMLVVFIQ